MGGFVIPTLLPSMNFDPVILFLKAVTTKEIWIDGYTKSDGTYVPGHHAKVHVSDDHDDYKVATGQGTYSQKQAHAKLSKEPHFQKLPVAHQAALVMKHGYEIQAKASLEARASTFKQKILKGQTPTKGEVSAFLEVSDKKRAAILAELQAAGQQYVDAAMALAQPGGAAPKVAAEQTSAADPKATAKQPVPAQSSGSDPISDWVSFADQHWGDVQEAADAEPFLNDPKLAGPAALAAYGASGFAEINADPDSPVAKELLSYIGKLPAFDSNKELHRVMGFGSATDVSDFLKQLTPAADTPGTQIKTVSSWTVDDPSANGQNEMNNIALDLASQFGDHKVFMSLKSGHKSAKDVSFLYSQVGQGDPGTDVLLPHGTKLDVVSIKKDGLKTHVVVREVHEGDTKPGANGGTLVLKDGRWHKAGGDVPAPQQAPAEAKPTAASPAPANAPVASGQLNAAQLGMLQSIPWYKLKLPDTNVNAPSVNKKLKAVQDAAFAGDVEKLSAMKFGSNTYGKKLSLIAQTALAALKEGADGATPVAAASPVVAPAAAPAAPKVEAASPAPAPQAGSKMSQIPWDKQFLPDTNSNAGSHNKAISKIKAMAEAGDVAGLQAFADSKAGAKQTYAKKQGLLAQLALAAIKEDGETASTPAAPADAPDLGGPTADSPVPPSIKKTLDGMAEKGDKGGLEAVIANNAHNPHFVAYAQGLLDKIGAKDSDEPVLPSIPAGLEYGHQGTAEYVKGKLDAGDFDEAFLASLKEAVKDHTFGGGKSNKLMAGFMSAAVAYIESKLSKPAADTAPSQPPADSGGPKVGDKLKNSHEVSKLPPGSVVEFMHGDKPAKALIGHGHVWFAKFKGQGWQKKPLTPQQLGWFKNGDYCKDGATITQVGDGSFVSEWQQKFVPEVLTSKLKQGEGDVGVYRHGSALYVGVIGKPDTFTWVGENHGEWGLGLSPGQAKMLETGEGLTQVSSFDAPQPSTDAAPQATEAPSEAPQSAGGSGWPTTSFKHTKTGADQFAVPIPKKLGDADYKAMAALAKEHGGHYSSYKAGGAVAGFLFKTEAQAHEFAAKAGAVHPVGAAAPTAAPTEAPTEAPTASPASSVALTESEWPEYLSGLTPVAYEKIDAVKKLALAGDLEGVQKLFNQYASDSPLKSSTKFAKAVLALMKAKQAAASGSASSPATVAKFGTSTYEKNADGKWVSQSTGSIPAGWQNLSLNLLAGDYSGDGFANSDKGLALDYADEFGHGKLDPIKALNGLFPPGPNVKEGDTKTINGVTYILKNGRWHKMGDDPAKADKPAAADEPVAAPVEAAPEQPAKSSGKALTQFEVNALKVATAGYSGADYKLYLLPAAMAGDVDAIKKWKADHVGVQPGTHELADKILNVMGAGAPAAPVAKKLTPSMITAAFNQKPPTNSFIIKAKKAAKLGDAKMIYEAWKEADAAGFPKTTALIGKLAKAMGVSIGQMDGAIVAAASAPSSASSQWSWSPAPDEEGALPFISGMIDGNKVSVYFSEDGFMAHYNPADGGAMEFIADGADSAEDVISAIKNKFGATGGLEESHIETLENSPGTNPFASSYASASSGANPADKKKVIFSPPGGGEPAKKYAQAMNQAVKTVSLAEVLDSGIPAIDGWEKTGGQKGSNTGGFYKDSDGQEWYCKFPDSEDHVKNELLAGKLYEAVGIKVPQIKKVRLGGKLGIASKVIGGLKKDADALKSSADMAAGFAADCWLANWDVVGLAFDNALKGPDGSVYRIDPGGALLFRAQGTPKGDAFGDHISEFDTLLDPKKNSQSALVFGGLTHDQIKDSVKSVLLLKDSAIEKLCQAYGPGDAAAREALAKKLIARKRDLALKFPDVADEVKPKIEVKIAPAPNFKHWNDDGSGLSSKPHINDDNQMLADQMQALAQSGDVAALENFHFQPIGYADGKPVGSPEHIQQHKSKHIKTYWQDLINNLKNPIEVVSHLKDVAVETVGGVFSTIIDLFDDVKSLVEAPVRIGRYALLGMIDGDPFESWKIKELSHNNGQISNQELYDLSQKSYAKLTGIQKQAIKQYTGSGYGSMNNAATGVGTHGNTDYAISGIDKASVPLKPGTVLSRKFPFQNEADLKKFLESEGGIVKDFGMISTATTPHTWSGPVHLRIVCGEGVKGLFVAPDPSIKDKIKSKASAISMNPGENEVILPYGTKFFVRKVHPVGTKFKDEHGSWGTGGPVVELVALPNS